MSTRNKVGAQQQHSRRWPGHAQKCLTMLQCKRFSSFHPDKIDSAASRGDHIDRTRASTRRPLSDRAATAMRWDQRDDKKGSEIKEDRHIFRMPILPRRASEGTKRIEWSCDHVRVEVLRSSARCLSCLYVLCVDDVYVIRYYYVSSPAVQPLMRNHKWCSAAGHNIASLGTTRSWSRCRHIPFL